MRITDKELKEIINELSERCKDMVFQTAKGHLRKDLSQQYVERALEEPSENTLIIEFDYTFCAGDLKQILGRLRRKPPSLARTE